MAIDLGLVDGEVFSASHVDSIEAAINAAQASIDSHEAAWTSYTPTFGNVTLGSGTKVGKYKKIGKTVFFYAAFVYGSGSAVTGTITVTTPTTMASGTWQAVGTIVDASVSNIRAYWLQASTTTFGLYVENSAGTYVTPTASSGTVPMTWTTSDAFYIQGVYEEA